MRKRGRIFAAGMAAVMMIACAGLLGCGKEPSKSVTKYELIRPDYAREMEAQHDAEGREHIAIPDDADTVTVDGIEYTVLRDWDHLDDLTGNYILANDIGWTEIGSFEKPFSGRFHGNNYKVRGEKREFVLFKYTENAVIQNIIISSDSKGELNKYIIGILIDYAEESVIRDCVNYYQPDFEESDYSSFPMVTRVENCEILGLINYADLYAYWGGIVGVAQDTTVKGCVNFGNISTERDSGNGGIVGRIYGQSSIEDCINYGDLIGTGTMGGILGKVMQNSYYDSEFNLNNPEDFLDTQIVRNCKNYGDIYLLKEEGDTRTESVSHGYEQNVYCIGGIAGCGSVIEACVNEGNFYGFESLGKKLRVKYLGGIAGAAKKAENCRNTGVWTVQKGRGEYVGDPIGYTIGQQS